MTQVAAVLIWIRAKVETALAIHSVVNPQMGRLNKLTLPIILR